MMSSASLALVKTKQNQKPTYYEFHDGSHRAVNPVQGPPEDRALCRRTGCVSRRLALIPGLQGGTYS